MKVAEKINLPAAVERFVALVVEDLRIESAWLSALSYMEEVAANQILGNVSDRTPPEFLAEIHAHAADEMRHSAEFTRMRPVQNFDTPELAPYRELELQMRRIAASFVVGYGGNSVLITSRSRHIAYVHAALTIEQFPFQLYTAYLKATKLPQVLAGLPAVLADENGHINLGRKMRTEIPEDRKLSIGALNEIEKEMCLRLVQRLERVVSEFTGRLPIPSVSTLARAANTSAQARVAWVQTLGGLPPEFLTPAHSQLLRRMIYQFRQEFLSEPHYRALETEMSSALAAALAGLSEQSSEKLFEKPFEEAMCVFSRHFSEFRVECDDVGIAYALGRVHQERGPTGEVQSAESTGYPEWFTELSRSVIQTLQESREFGTRPGFAVATAAFAAEAVARVAEA
ncbi:MAG: hypothetical protein H7222_17890 [Methylotenera sp.]|nr:hypothetical protein [Oligoflexia bacterium]